MEIDIDEILKNLAHKIEGNLDTTDKITKDFYCDEKDLLNSHEKDFSYQVKQRGLNYYYSHKVIDVFKSKNKYIAKVMGSDEEAYKVVLELTADGINYSCTCPCTFPCKHEYAVLIAISNKKYLEIELKEEIQECEANFKTVLEKIPAEEIKTYLLSDIGRDNVTFEREPFTNYFRKYYPEQQYEYYYNNLYNALVTGDKYIALTEMYLDRVKQYIFGNNFSEVFKIIKALIDAYRDTDKLNYETDFINMLPNIGMFLRIAYRKSSEKVKEEIETWISELEVKNFYNNYYLEDILLSIK